jgi:hypothetical protein
VPRNPLIEDLNVALPATRRTGAFDIEDLGAKRQIKAAPPPTSLPRPPWICPLCGTRLPSAQAMIDHNHGPKGPTGKAR